MKFKEYLNESILKKLMKSGKVYIDNDEYIGKAADCNEVNLGNVGDEKNVEKYLKANPNPKDW